MFRELTPPETFEELTQNGDAVLIDCRAPAEWHFTGVPDLSSIGKKPLLAAIADGGRAGSVVLADGGRLPISPI
ncbi:MAG: hypothetical protein VXW17_10340 [Pseudomonadota bacterium]|nr:hypothetical protein [Pseudomonadota bacterium]